MSFPHINNFTNGFEWLHNDYSRDIAVANRIYPSVTHAFSALQWNNDKWRDYCEKQIDVEKVKSKLRAIPTETNWDNIKVKVMYSLLNKKFENNELQNNLLMHDGLIQYGNYDGDTFWGIDVLNFPFTSGKNILGILLMRVRSIIRKGKIEEENELNEFL